MDSTEAPDNAYLKRLQRANLDLKRENLKLQNIVRRMSVHLEKQISELTDRADRDPRTGLINYDNFKGKLNLFLRNEQRVPTCIVGLIDCDDFKGINDNLGHHMGDEILMSIGCLMEDILRPGDWIARERRGEPREDDYCSRRGGDEFIFMIPGPANVRAGRKIGERFQKAMVEYSWPQEVIDFLGHPVYASIGIVWYELDSCLARLSSSLSLTEKLIRRADSCMYKAKDRTTARLKETGTYPGPEFSRVYTSQVTIGKKRS